MRTLALILIFTFLFAPSVSHAGELRIGATYSPRQSEYLGQDWKETYAAILDMGFDIIRLGAYWSRIEKNDGSYDFTYLDWQIEEASKRNIPVILTVGMKAPRWPEYYIPERLLKRSRHAFGSDVSQDAYLREETLKFIKEVLTRYGNKSIICSWQVENEPLDRSGPRQWRIGPEFLREEIDLVRSLDARKRPILINVATYPNRFLRFVVRVTASVNSVDEAIKVCDILGLNVYPSVGHELWSAKLHFRTSPGGRKRYFFPLVEKARKHGKKIWVTELQAEPWEPGKLVHKEKGLPATIRPESIKAYVEEMRELGIGAVLLWGAEYWHFRRERHGDEEWLKKIVDIMKEK